MWLTVGRDQSFGTIILIARRADWTEVAAVGPEGLVAGFHLLKVRQRKLLLPLPQALIHPIPNEAALQVGFAVDLAPIRPEIAGAVAHGVLILAHDVGPRLRLGGVLV